MVLGFMKSSFFKFERATSDACKGIYHLQLYVLFLSNPTHIEIMGERTQIGPVWNISHPLTRGEQDIFPAIGEL